jgi:hypothetical protein
LPKTIAEITSGVCTSRGKHVFNERLHRQLAFSAKPSNEGIADTVLAMFGLHGLEFDGDFFTRGDVNSQVDITS